MPYVEQSQRRRLDPYIDVLVKVLREAGTEHIDGELNYTIARLFRPLYRERCFDFNRIMGVLESVKQEYYRRWAAPTRIARTRKGETYPSLRKRNSQKGTQVPDYS